jgi:hypothetical protein
MFAQYAEIAGQELANVCFTTKKGAHGGIPPRKPIMSFRDLESELNQSREDR